MLVRVLGVVVLLIGLVLSGVEGYGATELDIEPIRVRIHLPESRSKSKGQVSGIEKVTITNTGQKKVVLNVEVKKWSQNLTDREVLDVTDEIAVYPTQLQILPNQSKSVKIAYVGQIPLKGERAYRLILQEVMDDVVVVDAGIADRSSLGNEVRILLRVSLPVFVYSSEVEFTGEELQCEKSAKEVDLKVHQDGDRSILVVANRGHMYLPPESEVVVSQDTGQIEETVRPWYVLAGAERRFVLSKKFDPEKTVVKVMCAGREVKVSR